MSEHTNEGRHVLETPRDRFDIPVEWRKKAEREIRAHATPMFATTLGNAAARKALDIIMPVLLNLAAWTAHDWVRRHQLGDKYVGWVDVTNADLEDWKTPE